MVRSMFARLHGLKKLRGSHDAIFQAHAFCVTGSYLFRADAGDGGLRLFSRPNL